MRRAAGSNTRTASEMKRHERPVIQLEHGTRREVEHSGHAAEAHHLAALDLGGQPLALSQLRIHEQGRPRSVAGSVTPASLISGRRSVPARRSTVNSRPSTVTAVPSGRACDAPST